MGDPDRVGREPGQVLAHCEVLYRLADALAERGRRTEAKRVYEQVFQVTGPLCTHLDPAVTLAAQEVHTQALVGAGDVALEWGHVDRARDRYQHALELCEALAAAETDNPRYRREVALGLARRADVGPADDRRRVRRVA
jgi:hypothetical protein